MKGGFQKSLQLFVANGYCEFEDNIRVDLPNVLDGKPNYANSLLPKFSLGLGAPLAWPPSESPRSRCM